MLYRGKWNSNGRQNGEKKSFQKLSARHSHFKYQRLAWCICQDSFLQFAFRDSLLWVFNYLRQSDGAAECDGYTNVVAHPQVDSMDASAHVDHIVQAFTLIHRAEEVST